jgi:hypothetical protein
MPVASSAERLFDVPAAARAAMVLLGWVPALHVVLTLTPVVAAAAGWVGPGIAWLTPAILYLLPPIAVRLIVIGRPLTAGRIELNSGAFLRWWSTTQWQMLFARMPWLEEALRLIPGAYSMWLRLWGARVGSLVYWSPGVVVIDRSLVDVGSRVAFGAGVRVVSHVIAPAESYVGRAGPERSGLRTVAALFVGPVTIGDDALVGAYSTLLPGCIVAPGEVTPPFKSIHPFTRLTGGRRSRLPGAPTTEATDADRG